MMYLSFRVRKQKKTFYVTIEHIDFYKITLVVKRGKCCMSSSSVIVAVNEVVVVGERVNSYQYKQLSTLSLNAQYA